MIYITSDCHFCHDREFIYKPRGFDSVEQMNEAIIQNWNAKVGMDDEVYLLGDVMLNDDDEGLRCLKSLNGKIHIISGNHDTDVRLEKYKECPNVVSVNHGDRIKYDNIGFRLTHYPMIVNNTDDNKKPWNRIVYNICGHSHTNDVYHDTERGRIIHCEMDTNNCTPWSMEEIVNLIKNRYN